MAPLHVILPGHVPTLCYGYVYSMSPSPRALLGGPTQHFWRKNLVSTLRFFKGSQNSDTGPATKGHRSLIITTTPIEPNGLNSLMGRNVAPYIHGNPIFLNVRAWVEMF